MNYVEVISNITLNENIEKLNYSDAELEFIYQFWDNFRDGKNEKVEEIKKIFLEKRTIDDYNLFLKIIKELNKDFYAFAYFRDEEIDSLSKNILINRIFKEYCLSNCANDLIYFMTHDLKLDQNVSKQILHWFYEALNFSIQNNYNGKRFVKILEETYLINENILKDLIRLYDDNLIMLKLNYIIKKINIK